MARNNDGDLVVFALGAVKQEKPIGQIILYTKGHFVTIDPKRVVESLRRISDIMHSLADECEERGIPTQAPREDGTEWQEIHDEELREEEHKKAVMRRAMEQMRRLKIEELEEIARIAQRMKGK